MAQCKSTEITIGGERLVLRWTLGALEDLEDRLGGGLMDIAGRGARMGWSSVRVSHIVRILHAGAVGGMAKDAPDLDRLLSLVEDETVPSTFFKVWEALAHFIVTPDEAQRQAAKMDADPKDPTPPAT